MASSVASPKVQRQVVQVLKPAVKAYVFAYLSLTSPTVIALVLALLRGKQDARDVIARLLRILGSATLLDRFPACCSILVAGSTITPRLLIALLSRGSNTSKQDLRRLKNDGLFRWISAFLSALAAFSLLNRRPARPIPGIGYEDRPVPISLERNVDTSRRRKRSSVSFHDTTPIQATTIPPLAGRTLDLTTFGIVHATVILSSTILHNIRIRTRTLDPVALKTTRTNHERYIAPLTFILSSSIIMWNWFYSPDRLPASYNQWIKSAAQIDGRLIQALREVRFRTLMYGHETAREHSELLGSLARELGFPETWGDLSKTVPIPCELYHSGTGKSCEWHGLSRFARAWMFALRMYLPLNMLMLLRRGKRVQRRQTSRAFLDAGQSAAFLGSFVALFYYGVCLGRTRLGPKIIGTGNAARMIIDGGVCVGVGCFACGWSILLEKAGRRPEMALFVAPRALATLLPRRYDRRYLWREQLAFALSAATILTAAQRRPGRVKGVFGRLLGQVFE